MAQNADQHILAVREALLNVENKQRELHRATKHLHATLSRAGEFYRVEHGHDTPVMAAAVAPKERPD